MNLQSTSSDPLTNHVRKWSGTLQLLHAFDVGDDIQFSKVLQQKLLPVIPAHHPKYFKNYHLPLWIAPALNEAPCNAVSMKLHSFGVISLRYEVPFSCTIDELKQLIIDVDAQYEAQSLQDAYLIFQKIHGAIKQPSFFNVRTDYTVIQITPQSDLDVVQFQQQYGTGIASALRFETEQLSDYQKDELLASAFGYYRGDLVIVDIEAACLYDDDPYETIDLFEFANLQHLELQFFDRLLDERLNAVYDRRIQAPSWWAYMPFITSSGSSPIGELEQLKVDISVITERLEHSIKSVGDVYYLELYNLLSQKLDLNNWTDSIQKKLQIIEHISHVYQTKIDSIRSDLLSLAVIVLIFLELVILMINK
jgi:hypothetical protein